MACAGRATDSQQLPMGWSSLVSDREDSGVAESQDHFLLLYCGVWLLSEVAQVTWTPEAFSTPAACQGGWPVRAPRLPAAYRYRLWVPQKKLPMVSAIASHSRPAATFKFSFQPNSLFLPSPIRLPENSDLDSLYSLPLSCALLLASSSFINPSIHQSIHNG